MGISKRLQNAWKALSGVQSIKSLPQVSQTYAWVGGFPIYNPTDTIANINNGYVGSDDVYSIVRRIARTAAMVPLKVYKIVDDEQLKNYELVSAVKSTNTQHLVRKQFLKSKALELVPDTNPLQNLLNNPNPSYSKTEFLEGCYTFRLVTGNTYIHTPALEFGRDAGKPIELWIMPSQWTSLQVSDTWPRRVIGYRLQLANLIDIPKEEVVHVKYFNPQYSYIGNELIGLSPLRAGSKILDRQIAETDYSVNAFQNSGISGIVSNENMNSDEIEKGALGQMKTDFYNEAAGTGNARKLLFTVGKITYTAIGLSPVDMDILNSEVRTFKKLCNLYGVSDRLFNNDATGSEISVDVAYKDLYTNAVLPEVYALRDSLNKYLVPKFNTGSEKYYIDCDITAIPELQDDFKDMATVFSTIPLMNPKVIAKAMGWDDDDVQDVWLVKNGYTSINELLNGIAPLPIDTDDGN
jgi:HK97 family phage portal protein